MSEFDTLSVERDGRLSFLTFERPDKLNALNPRVVSELRRAVDDLADLDDNRAVVVRGEGRAFVAGADINELAVQSPTDGRAHALRGQEVFDAIENL
ncbi:MAG: enoyl-CoA hydratase/isomerase family protein, partial [Bradymonadaceae bacterium]